MMEISLRMETVLGSRLLYDGNQSENGNCSWFKAAILWKSVCEWKLFLVQGCYMMQISLENGNCSWFKSVI